MARPASNHPTDGELEILNILWDSGSSTLGQVCDALRQERPVATTTIATMLKVMLGKKLVKRTQGPRGYLWSARVSRKTAATGLVGKLLEGVFEGSAHRLVAHLLEAGELSKQDRQQIRRMLEEYNKRKKS